MKTQNKLPPPAGDGGRYPKEIVVGDNGHVQRKCATCIVSRKSLAGMKPGDRIVVSFTDEFKDRTPRRCYRCEKVSFLDEFDRKIGRATVTLRIDDERGVVG